MLLGLDDIPDANPEAIIVGAPLDGTKNSPTALGNRYEDITGVITYQYAWQLLVLRSLLISLSQVRFLLCPTLHSSKNNLLP